MAEMVGRARERDEGQRRAAEEAPRQVGVVANVRAFSRATDAPPSGLGHAGVLALQRLAGNAATAARLSGARHPVVQRDLTEDVDNGQGAFTNITSDVMAGAQIGTGAYLQNVDPTSAGNNTGANIANSDTGMVASSLALPGAMWSLGLSAKQHHDALNQRDEAKKSGNKARLRAGERNVRTTGGDVAGNTLNASSAITNVVSSGYSVAANTTSALSTASNAAGVAGGVVGMPIALFSLVRSSRRAELQRQRMVRTQQVSEGLKAMTTNDKDELSPEKIIQSKTDAKTQSEQLRDDAKVQLTKAQSDRERLEKHRADSEADVQRLQKQLADLNAQIQSSQAVLEASESQEKANPNPLRRQRALATGRSVTDDFDRQRRAITKLDRQRAGLQKQIDEVQKDLKEATEAVAAQDEVIKQHQDEIAEHEASAKEHGERVTQQSEMQDQTAESGHLTDTGEADKQMPTLEEIADYTVRKNKRGFSRRTIGAVAAGIGLAGATVGLASAIQSFQGASDANALGIGAAAIGGLAAAIGIGVGIWKAVSFVKKRKAQAKKMAAVAAKQGSQAKKPTFLQTYNPFRKTVDQTTKRRHYAMALYVYATQGTDEQRQQAQKIMTSLDPKGPWAEKDLADAGRLKPLDAVQGPEAQKQKDELVDHFMNKMASGG